MNFLKNIPLSRGLIYVLSLGLLPFCFLLFQFFGSDKEIDELRESLLDLQDQVFIKEKKQALNLAVMNHFKEADHFYVDKQLETIMLLEPELKVLQNISKDKNFADDERIKKRIEYLSTSANTLNFTEGVVQKFPFFQETTETMIHPVEVNPSDIKKILARVEGIEIGDYKPSPNRPQLIITEFQIDKKRVPDQNEVYQLNMKLLKREYL